MLSQLAALLLSQALYVDGGVYSAGDFRVEVPYVSYLPYASISVLRGWLAGGVSIVTSRAAGDVNADLDIWHSGRTAGQAWRASNGSLVVGQLEWNGTLWAGGQSNPRAFVSMGGAYTCQPGSGGCYTTIYGGMANKGFHGAVVLGNQEGNPDRDGGLSLQVLGRGKTNSYAGTVLAQDVYGNLQTYGGLHGNYLEPQDFDACTTTWGWDNPTAALDSPGGFFRPLGMWGYRRDTARIQLCTPGSATRDGGYEAICTDTNGACRELPPGAAATATNDALVITQTLPDGGTRTAVIPWVSP